MSIVSKLPFANQLRTGVFFWQNLGAGAEQFRVLKHYLTGKLFREHGDGVHLTAAVEWLARAQDVCGGDGVSSVFSLKTGWGVAYPETSGYILATYFAYADYSGDKTYIDRAIQIGDWEIAIQAPNGGVYSSTDLRQTRVFNTGQVILGWCTLYERTGEDKYLQAAKRAGDYLLNEQETEDGTWRKDTYCGARTYHARVDWSLLRLAQLAGDQRYAVVALKNLQWVMKQQKENGWFAQCGFNNDQPIMHVIVYTLRGLLECSQISDTAVKELDILPAVIKSADALCKALQAQPIAGIAGMVPTAFNEDWKATTNDSCLTGNAQLACFLYRLAHVTDKQMYRDVADIVMSATKRTQLIGTSLPQIDGAIAGTFPLSHGYLANAYPNWAAKFFADALLMKINYNKKLVIPA
jgi:uncharacterized protein YyaL (SSP411 family)